MRPAGASPRGEAREWTVDGDGPADFYTIQGAINAASDGDTITIRDGTYCEEVHVTKAVTIRAANVGECILDGRGAARRRQR